MIKTIDIRDFETGSVEQRTRIAEAWDVAFSCSGFCLIKGHEVSRALSVSLSEALYASRHIAPPPSCIVIPLAVEANGRLRANAASWIDRITKGVEVEHLAKRALFAKTLYHR